MRMRNYFLLLRNFSINSALIDHAIENHMHKEIHCIYSINEQLLLNNWFLHNIPEHRIFVQSHHQLKGGFFTITHYFKQLNFRQQAQSTNVSVKAQFERQSSDKLRLKLKSNLGNEIF